MLKHSIAFGLALFVSVSAASDWELKSQSGGMFDDPNKQVIIVEFDGNKVVLERPFFDEVTGEALEPEPLTTNDIYNLNVIALDGQATRKQMFGFLTSLENILTKVNKQSESTSFGNLMDDREDMLNRIRTLRAVLHKVK